MEPADPIRILVADDHPVVRGGLVALLRTIEGFEVVGEAADGEAAIREAQLTRPDIALMDVRMPGLDGVEATRRIRAAVPTTRVLMLTMYDDDDTVFTAMRAGAQGYLLKEAEQEEIVRAVRGVVAGEAIFGQGVAERVLRYFAGSGSGAWTGSPGGSAVGLPEGLSGPDYPFPELTERERVVLEALARGRRTSEIAAELYLSPKTVANNMTSIYVKLQVASRAEAIVRAHQSGLGGQGASSELGRTE